MAFSSQQRNYTDGDELEISPPSAGIYHLAASTTDFSSSVMKPQKSTSFASSGIKDFPSPSLKSSTKCDESYFPTPVSKVANDEFQSLLSRPGKNEILPPLESSSSDTNDEQGTYTLLPSLSDNEEAQEGIQLSLPELLPSSLKQHIIIDIPDDLEEEFHYICAASTIISSPKSKQKQQHINKDDDNFQPTSSVNSPLPPSESKKKQRSVNKDEEDLQASSPPPTSKKKQRRVNKDDDKVQTSSSPSPPKSKKKQRDSPASSSPTPKSKKNLRNFNKDDDDLQAWSSLSPPKSKKNHRPVNNDDDDPQVSSPPPISKRKQRNVNNDDDDSYTIPSRTKPQNVIDDDEGIIDDTSPSKTPRKKKEPMFGKFTNFCKPGLKLETFKPYKPKHRICTTCGEKFYLSVDLRNHLLTHREKNNTDSDVGRVEEKSSSANLVSKIVGSSTSSKELSTTDFPQSNSSNSSLLPKDLVETTNLVETPNPLLTINNRTPETNLSLNSSSLVAPYSRNLLRHGEDSDNVQTRNKDNSKSSANLVPKIVGSSEEVSTQSYSSNSMLVTKVVEKPHLVERADRMVATNNNNKISSSNVVSSIVGSSEEVSTQSYSSNSRLVTKVVETPNLVADPILATNNSISSSNVVSNIVGTSKEVSTQSDSAIPSLLVERSDPILATNNSISSSNVVSNIVGSSKEVSTQSDSSNSRKSDPILATNNSISSSNVVSNIVESSKEVSTQSDSSNPSILVETPQLVERAEPLSATSKKIPVTNLPISPSTDLNSSSSIAPLNITISSNWNASTLNIPDNMSMSVAERSNLIETANPLKIPVTNIPISSSLSVPSTWNALSPTNMSGNTSLTDWLLASLNTAAPNIPAPSLNWSTPESSVFSATIPTTSSSWVASLDNTIEGIPAFPNWDAGSPASASFENAITAFSNRDAGSAPSASFENAIAAFSNWDAGSAPSAITAFDAPTPSMTEWGLALPPIQTPKITTSNKAIALPKSSMQKPKPRRNASNSNPKTPCPICQLPLSSKTKLSDHLYTHDANRIKDKLCPICGKGFYRVPDMKKHMRTHLGVGNYVTACGRRFSRPDVAEQHRRITDCGVCNAEIARLGVDRLSMGFGVKFCDTPLSKVRK